MSVPDTLNSNLPGARTFTPHTPFHDPHLDPNVPKENHHMVPQALFAGRKLNREIPKAATANLHVVLKLTNEPNKLQKEFHDKIPQINDILGLWGEVKAANPTTTGEAQLRSRGSISEDGDWTCTTEESKGNIFDLVSNLDTPGRGDIIYLADASEDGAECGEDSGIPPNLRTTEWLGSNGSYVHLKDAEPELNFDTRSMSKNNTPFNLRVAEWLDDEQCDALPNEASSLQPVSNSEADSREAGPYETFWTNYH